MTEPRTDILPCVEIEPEGPPAGSVVWLHGLGASGHDFEDVVPLLERPDVRFVFPHAPRRPVTINMGLIMPAWYDIERLDSPRSHANARHVAESCGLVSALVEREVARGVPASRIVLAGFSQGGAIALHLGTRYPETLLGLLVLSAYELFPDRRDEQAAANAATPLLFCHGLHDPLIPIARARAAYEAHATAARPAEWHEYAMEHAMCMEEIEAIRRWLADRFAPAPEGAQ
jgi:phospholipase/carboxylesterase